MGKDKGQLRRNLRSKLIEVLFFVILGLLIFFGADVANVKTWFTQQLLREEYVRFDIDAVTESGKTVWLGTVTLWGEDAKIKFVTVTERDASAKKDDTKQLKTPEGVSWIFR